MTSFLPPSFDEPVDVSAYLAGAPEDGKARGMFLEWAVQDAARAGRTLPGHRSYVAFGYYPLREYQELLVEAARAVHPELPLREGLRRLGREVYPGFERTMIGKAIFAVAGRSLRRVIELCPRAYDVSISPGTVRVVESRDGYARLELRDLWNFADCYQVGVFEGGLTAMGATGSVRVRHHSLCDVDFEIEWRSY